MFIPSFLGFVFEGVGGVRVPHAVSVYHVTDPSNRANPALAGLPAGRIDFSSW